MTDSPSRRIALSGASRGLGLTFTRLWLQAGHEVCALSRSAASSSGLASLQAEFPQQLQVIAGDVSRDEDVARVTADLQARWQGLDLLLNNAGIYPVKRDRLEALDLESWRQTMEVNALGPIRLTRALLPLLRQGRQPRVVNMTSLMGSIADNSSGGSWAYRMSKTALNMATRNMAHELAGDGIIAVVLHPGWVQTDMGGAGAPLSIDESVTAMVATIDRLGSAQSGGFFDRHGEPLPW